MTQTADKDSVEFDMDSLLESTIEDLADAPEFRPFVQGAHVVDLTLSRSDKIDEKTKKPEPVFLCKIKLVETQEQTDPTEAPLEVGAETTIRFRMDNPYGEGDFKKVAGEIAAHFKCANVREVLEAAKNLRCLVVTTNRKGKKRDDGTYPLFTSITALNVL